MSTPVVATPAAEPIHVERGNSPWQGYTSSAEEEERGRHIAAVVVEPHLARPPHLARFTLDGEPLLVIDRTQRRVVVNQRAFSAIERVDATRLGKGDRAVLGRVVDAKLRARGRELVTFLVSSELIQTYMHIGAKLTLGADDDSAKTYRVRVTGTHVYFTNSRHESRLDFEVAIDKQSGEIVVTGI